MNHESVSLWLPDGQIRKHFGLPELMPLKEADKLPLSPLFLFFQNIKCKQFSIRSEICFWIQNAFFNLYYRTFLYSILSIIPSSRNHTILWISWVLSPLHILFINISLCSYPLLPSHSVLKPLIFS